uniref:Uncharacterized protein n=1 Tax=Caenorhabditis tropicalis TaxID=1561998 RepID=A0A1I7UQC7_9PELO
MHMTVYAKEKKALVKQKLDRCQDREGVEALSSVSAEHEGPTNRSKGAARVFSTLFSMDHGGFKWIQMDDE